MHKAGFINIVGKPNAGKSTFCNVLSGEKLSIVSHKASTTRHRILGILNSDDYQIILSDTPGIIDPAYKLHESMMTTVQESIEDADILIVMVDVSRPKLKEENLQNILAAKCPKFLVLNKIDLSNPVDLTKTMEQFKSYCQWDEILCISALNGLNPESVINLILKYLPEHEPYFPKDQLTDRNMRFFVSEMIREKIFNNYEEEIPYSTEVIVHDYKEDRNIDRIYAYVIVEKESQKGIILGKGGESIKKIGIEARQDIEKFIEKKVFLDLRVKVERDWRKDERKLKHWGYES